MDFAAAGLLDGLEGDERAAREELLATLAGEGYALEELSAAVAEDRLALLPLERVLGARYTAAEAAERASVPVELLVRFHRLMGLPEPNPDDRVFSEDDVAAARATDMFLASGLSEDAIVEITRVLGESMARLAATTTAAFVEAFLKPGDTERDVARRFQAVAQQLVPAIDPVLAAAYGAHLREAVGRGMIGREERAAGQIAGAQEIAVCFADLVGFTRLGGEVEVQELGNVAGKLARLAAEVTEPPVRLVKTIGDAAMFVSPEPAALVAAALSLVEATQEAELPSLRAGIAFGEAYLRSGDFYGHSVNLASRVTGVARPDSVLCTKEVRECAPEQFDWSSAGRFRLKGVAEPSPLYRAHRLGEHEAKRPTEGRRRRRASR
ncbi:MAG TPA: adenylate cyclase regulatory domain-containing protein [Solirubrobacteraceae bacterium]|nr:adenylate cyclase regulatory domain-containing protein [Solirubrobacteraceae bacterium]